MICIIFASYWLRQIFSFCLRHFDSLCLLYYYIWSSHNKTKRINRASCLISCMFYGPGVFDLGWFATWAILLQFSGMKMRVFKVLYHEVFEGMHWYYLWCQLTSKLHFVHLCSSPVPHMLCVHCVKLQVSQHVSSTLNYQRNSAKIFKCIVLSMRQLCTDIPSYTYWLLFDLLYCSFGYYCIVWNTSQQLCRCLMIIML